jgi:chromosome segregation ATPase
MNHLQAGTTLTKKFSNGLLAAALGAGLLAGGCASKQETEKLQAQKQQLSEENKKLSDSLETLRSESTEANATIAEVQKGLEDIRAKELAALRTSLQVAEEGKGTSTRREQLQAEMKMIRAAIQKNLQKLARLQKTNQENGVQIASLQSLSDELKRSLEEKDAMVAELQTKVGELSTTVKSQAATIEQHEATIHEGETKIAQTTKELHTAYVAVASKNVLKTKGVVERRGDIAGLGGRWIETGKFDPEVFRAVDVTKDLEVEIPAPAKKVHVVTAQPKDSYQIVDGGPNAKTSKIEVKDPAAFWKGDRYLVVMTD